VCGAISGGVLVIGLLYGQDNADAVGIRTEEFVRRFAELKGAVQCNDLTGLDMSSEEGLREYDDRKVYEETCNGLVSNAVQLLLEDWGDK
jgi:C_GCAxxG_C_C family probable redox protein